MSDKNCSDINTYLSKIDKYLYPIYKEEASGNSLIVKNIKINDLDGKIVKLQYSNVISDKIKSNDVVNNKTVDILITTLGFYYKITTTFDLVSLISPDPSFIERYSVSLKAKLRSYGISDQIVDPNESITSKTYSIVSTVCISGLQQYEILIQVFSDEGVIIQNVENVIEQLGNC
jgi:hypothetical protein